MASCTSLGEFEEILQSVLIVAQSKSDGFMVGSETKTACELRKVYLLAQVRTFDSTIYGDAQEVSETNNDEFTENISSMDARLNIISERAVITRSQKGEHINVYYLPAVAQNILRIAKYCPLWSGILSICYKKPCTATSAHVDNYFNELKNSTVYKENYR
jgi:hypothetical protein